MHVRFSKRTRLPPTKVNDDLKKADASTSRDVTLYFVTAGKAFEAAIRTVSNYPPTSW